MVSNDSGDLAVVMRAFTGGSARRDAA